MGFSIKIPSILIFLFAAAAFQQSSAQTGIDDFHYQPAEGKYLGLWPHRDLGGKSDFEYYRNQLGFKYMMVLPRDSSWQLSTEQFENAVAAGYDSSTIIISMRFDNIDYCVENMAASSYYLGEPTEHNCNGEPSNESIQFIFNPSQLDSVRQNIYAHHPLSEFVIDGYKRCSHLIIAAEEADQIMYSSYENWNEINFNCSPELGWGENPEPAWLNLFTGNNQSDSWEDMRQLFGEKFSMSWMHGVNDEYAELFETADVIGLESIWIYGLTLADSIDGKAVMDTLQLKSICNIAYETGWLEKVYDIDFLPPYNFSAEESEGVVNLSWEDSTEYSSGYIIEKNSGKDTLFYFLDSLNAGEFVSFDSNIVENQTYYYRIYSYSDERFSSFSDTISVTISAAIISAPSDLKASTEEDHVNLSWIDNSDNETGFFIERKRSGLEMYELLDSTAKDSEEYTDTSIIEDGIYLYRIFAANEFTRSDYSDTAEVEFITTGIEINKPVYNLELHQNYPNPYNPSTTIKYSIPEFEIRNSESGVQNSDSRNLNQESNIRNQASVSLKVYDLLGREVASLVNGYKSPGNYQAVFNAEDLASGVYYYSLDVNGTIITKKMVLLR